MVLDAQDLERVQVDERDDPVYRVRPLVVARFRLHERHAPGEPPLGFLVTAEVTRRPGVDLDLLRIGDPAAGEGGLEFGMQAQQLLGLHQLGDDGHRLYVGANVPADHGAVVDRDNGLDRLRAAAVEEHDLGLTRRAGTSGLPLQDALLGRFLQRDRDEPAPVALCAVAVGGAHNRGGRGHLPSGQRVERMAGGGVLCSVHPVRSIAECLEPGASSSASPPPR